MLTRAVGLAVLMAMLGVGGASGYIEQSPYAVQMAGPAGPVSCAASAVIGVTVRDAKTGAPVGGQAVEWDLKTSLSGEDRLSQRRTVTDGDGRTSVTLTFGPVDGKRTVRAMIATFPATLAVTCTGASPTASPPPASPTAPATPSPTPPPPLQTPSPSIPVAPPSPSVAPATPATAPPTAAGASPATVTATPVPGSAATDSPTVPPTAAAAVPPATPPGTADPAVITPVTADRGSGTQTVPVLLLLVVAGLLVLVGAGALYTRSQLRRRPAK